VTRALVALGSNLGARESHLSGAIAGLSALPLTRLVAVSNVRETAPVDGPPGSGAFLNAVALLDTQLSPRALLAELQELEARAGRLRGERNAPRTLDLDLLLHGAAVVDEPGLQLPHPRLHLRAFVLEPACDVAPGLRHPLLGRTLRELRDALRPGGRESACAS
jgi:2-amino-4-hydroxy-6-hydroxymethyldihydropteridine diphosphokinase